MQPGTRTSTRRRTSTQSETEQDGGHSDRRWRTFGRNVRCGACARRTYRKYFRSAPGMGKTMRRRADPQGPPELPFPAQKSISEKIGAVDRADQQRRSSRDARYDAPDRHLFADSVERDAVAAGCGSWLQGASVARIQRRYRDVEAKILRRRRMARGGFSGVSGGGGESAPPRNAGIAGRRTRDE